MSDGTQKLISDLAAYSRCCQGETKQLVDAAADRIAKLSAELAALRAGAPDGWKLVPMEPTREMVEFGRRMVGELALSMRGYMGYITDENRSTWPEAYEYRAMLAAAPQPPAQAVAVRVKPLVWRAEWLGERETPMWRGYDVGGVAQAYISFAGQYEIELHSEVPAWEIERHKSRKQADYERRILSAIDARPEAAVKAEALREVIDLIQEDADCDTANRAYSDGLKAGIAHAVDVIDANADRLKREGA